MKIMKKMKMVWDHCEGMIRDPEQDLDHYILMYSVGNSDIHRNWDYIDYTHMLWKMGWNTFQENKQTGRT